MATTSATTAIFIPITAPWKIFADWSVKRIIGDCVSSWSWSPITRRINIRGFKRRAIPNIPITPPTAIGTCGVTPIRNIKTRASSSSILNRRIGLSIRCADQYFWHRFFHHQPDLNYDNPEVQKAMLRVVQFWIDQGADGIRVDAPPYLFEREGTNCENLPETHAYLKRLRAFVEAYAPGTMLLSEANQWPEDVRPYFGDGDEVHMNFHFPLMPRIFMALAKADRTPLVEILKRTPDLPTRLSMGHVLALSR